MFFRLFQIHISCVFFSFCLVLFLYLALVLAFVFDSTVNRRSIAWAYAVLYVWWHRWFFFRSSLSFFRLSYNTISSGSMSQNVPLKIHSNISWLHTHRASHQSEHIKVSKQMEGERERKKKNAKHQLAEAWWVCLQNESLDFGNRNRDLWIYIYICRHHKQSISCIGSVACLEKLKSRAVSRTELTGAKRDVTKYV